MKVGVSSKAVDNVYQKLLANLGNEFSILLDASLVDIEKAGSPLLRRGIAHMRAGKVYIAPGFDGEYGKIQLLEDVERQTPKGQTLLF